METQVSLVRIPQDSILDSSDVIDIKSTADFLQYISSSAKKALPKKEAEPTDEYSTPFQRFMHILLAEQSSKVTTTGGSAEWSSAPIKALIAQGLWPIMMKVAEKQNISLGTETIVLKDIAPKVEQMLNIGIMLAYGSPDAAAIEFKNTVLNRIDDAKTEPATLASSVQLTIAKFFGAILKTITPTKKQLLKKVKELYKANKGPANSIYISESIREGKLPSLVRLYKLGSIMDSQIKFREYADNDYPDLAVIGDALMVHEMTIKVAKKLPAKATELAREIQGIQLERITVTYEWLITQIILAVIDAPLEAGSVGTEEYSWAVGMCHEMPDEKIIQKTLHRFEKRGAPASTWTTDEMPLLLDVMKSRIAKIKNEISVNGIHHYILTHYQFDSYAKLQAKLTSEDALKLATAKEPLRSKLVANPAAVAHISTNMVWSSVMLGDLPLIILAAILPPMDIARGMLQMPDFGTALGHTWLDVCQELKEKKGVEYATPEAINFLLDQGVLKPQKNEKVVLSYRDNHTQIPKNKKAAYLCELLKTPDGDRDKTGLVLHFIQIVNNNIPFARKFFARPDLRKLIHTFFITELESNIDRLRNGINDEDFRLFRIAINEKLWLKFVLASEIDHRDDMYTQIKEGKTIDPRDVPLPHWEDLEEYQLASYKPSYACGFKPKKITQFLKTAEFSEVSIFRWLHENDPDCKERLKKYLKARKRYYQIVAKKIA